MIGPVMYASYAASCKLISMSRFDSDGRYFSGGTIFGKVKGRLDNLECISPNAVEVTRS